MALAVILTLVAYLVGSVPFGVIAARMLGKEDPRGSGSGNIGATNVLRSSGPMAALLTLFGDFSKGLIPTWAASSLDMTPLEISAVGLACFLGHLFPLYLRFRGGKGVATGAGVITAISPEAVLISAGAFGIACFVSRYVSLGSMVAALTAVLATLLLQGRSYSFFLCMTFAIGIIWRHHHNIRRILSGTEPKLWASKP